MSEFSIKKKSLLKDFKHTKAKTFLFGIADTAIVRELNKDLAWGHYLRLTNSPV